MNRKWTRILALILVITLVASLCAMPTYAETYSSAYILMTSASLSAGSSAGKISINYSITGMGIMDTIGALYIEVYRSSGSLFCTIIGNTTNGLLVNNTFVHAGSYVVTCVPGVSYYCKVTLIAAKDGGGDTRTLRTSTIVAPSSP